MFDVYYAALDPGGASGTACYFGSPTNISSSAAFYEYTANIIGAAGATVYLQVTNYSNTNSSGQVKVNGTQVFLNNTFTVTLDGSGDGSFVFRVEGNPTNTGTIVFARIEITAVSIGQIATPSAQQNSRAF